MSLPLPPDRRSAPARPSMRSLAIEPQDVVVDGRPDQRAVAAVIHDRGIGQFDIALEQRNRRAVEIRDGVVVGDPGRQLLPVVEGEQVVSHQALQIGPQQRDIVLRAKAPVRRRESRPSRHIRHRRCRCWDVEQQVAAELQIVPQRLDGEQARIFGNVREPVGKMNTVFRVGNREVVVRPEDRRDLLRRDFDTWKDLDGVLHDRRRPGVDAVEVFRQIGRNTG